MNKYVDSYNSLPDQAKKIIQRTIGIEGGYVNDPNDSGGATKYGVTERKARACGYTGDMRDLPMDFALGIAAVEYWYAAKIDQVATMSWKIAEEIFDTAYNTGSGGAWRIVQRACNASNRQGKDWPDISVDGAVGPKTLAALKAFIDRRGENLVNKILNVVQGAFYLDLVERREKDEAFFIGWIDHRVSL